MGTGEGVRSRQKDQDIVASAIDDTFNRMRNDMIAEVAGAAGERDGPALDLAVRSAMSSLRQESLRELARRLGVSLGDEMAPGNFDAGDVAGEPSQTKGSDSLAQRLMDFSKRLEKTKVDLAAIHHPGQAEDRLATAMFELDEIMTATERSTEEILNAAERLNDAISRLDEARQRGEDYSQEQVNKLVDEVMTIFEACNFQDLTGQRIQKVVDTLVAIESRLDSIVRHLGRDAFAHIPVPDERVGDPENLTGPAMQDTRTRPDQAGIDAIFEDESDTS